MPASDPTLRPVDFEWIKKVAMTDDRDQRGQLIALTYHQCALELNAYLYNLTANPEAVPSPVSPLSLRFATEGPERLGEDTADSPGGTAGVDLQFEANWFCFATWATMTLNHDITNAKPPFRGDRLLPLGFRRTLTPVMLKAKASRGQRLSQLLTWYQRLVFLNASLAFTALSDPNRDDTQSFVGVQEWKDEALKLSSWHGESALDPTRHLAQVASAFDYYRKARLVTKRVQVHQGDTELIKYLRRLRSRLILLGNLILVATEQDIVDPGVERVVNQVPEWAAQVVTARLASLAESTLGVPRRLAGLRLPIRLAPAQQVATDVWAHLLTREVLVLTLPCEILRVGRDIPPIEAGAPYFPADLTGLDDLGSGFSADDPATEYPDYFDKHQVDNEQLRNLVAAFDRSQGDGQGTAATDWRRIQDRLNWAVNLFRSRQFEQTLFWPPFRDADVERLRDGKLALDASNPTDTDLIPPLEGFSYRSGGGALRQYKRWSD
jgi:hypothetical protein